MRSSSRRAFRDGHVNDVFMIGSASQFPDASRSIGGHLVDFASGQHTSQAGLASPSSPPLGYYGGGTIGTTSSAMKPTWSAHMRRSLRSPATSAPVS
jgi:hypothetical protein